MSLSSYALWRAFCESIGRLPQAVLSFFIVDPILLYLGLLVGNKVLGDHWLLYHTSEWGVPALVVLGVYLGALSVSGTHRTCQNQMDLPDFIDIGTYLVRVWSSSGTSCASLA